MPPAIMAARDRQSVACSAKPPTKPSTWDWRGLGLNSWFKDARVSKDSRVPLDKPGDGKGVVTIFFGSARGGRDSSGPGQKSCQRDFLKALKSAGPGKASRNPRELGASSLRNSPELPDPLPTFGSEEAVGSGSSGLRRS